FSPSSGPVDGGTVITIHGRDLGSSIEEVRDRVFVGGSRCPVIDYEISKKIVCRVEKGTSSGPIRVTVGKTGSRTAESSQLYSFVETSVFSVYPPYAPVSGGTKQMGRNRFKLLYTVRFEMPSLVAISEAGTPSMCNFIIAVRKHFTSVIYNRTFKIGKFPVGFAMDNVTLVRNLGHRIQMRVVPDPEFAPFKGIRIHQGDQPLILDGSHLNEAAEPQDYKIFVGSERCYVTLVDSRQLVCNGPSVQPKATDERGQPIVGGLPLVSVTVGRLRSELGLIEYVDPIATLRLWVLMEHLESNVRKECKQAFAELQTSMESCGDDDYEVPALRLAVAAIISYKGMDLGNHHWLETAGTGSNAY
ncbi:unnamed protein product, partial [Nippostrongylus brasiliensis]|uniref:Plexin-2 (inferred by orthology to a C. elegans protein) n=1 Tax=Nippostrongylus brasiliensis TaxID=27835 RepID=A0A0N4YU80_NIPBR